MSFHSYGPNGADKDTIEEAVQIRLRQVEKLGGSLVVSIILLCTYFPTCRIESRIALV